MELVHCGIYENGLFRNIDLHLHFLSFLYINMNKSGLKAEIPSDA